MGFQPRPASVINPLSGYSHEPAPMGIADFGVTGTGGGAAAYTYSTDILVGNVHVNSMDISIPGHSSKVTAFELNEVLVLQLNGVNYSYWIQNGLHVDASSRQFTIGGAYVWNFSSAPAHLSAGELRGNSSSVLASDTYYFIPGCGVFAGQCSTLSWPGSFSGRVVTAVSGGIPYVDYQYDLGSGWVSYDNVSFLHMDGARDVGFVVDGSHSTPISANEFYDAEWIWAAAGGGLSSVAKTSDLQMSLDFWNGQNLQAVPNAFDFGGDTGETASNVSEAADVGGLAGSPSAHLTNGPGTLGVLYNRSSVGFLNLTVPTRSPATVDLNGAGIAIPAGVLNLTLAAGTYRIDLENYSNASQSVEITPGVTTFVNLTGAGRVDFRETGLPNGTAWGVSLGGTFRSSTLPTISFNAPNGSYAITYSAVPGFFRNGSDPLELTVPSPVLLTIAWEPFTYAVPFVEQGLPPSTSWWVSAGGSLQEGVGSTLYVSAPNGSTPYTAGSTFEFVASPSTGWINVTAGLYEPVEVQFGYRATFIAGTVSPENAQLTIDGAGQDVVAGAFNDSVIPGIHTLVASASGYTSQTLVVNASAGNVTTERIVLVALPAPGRTTTPASSSSGVPAWALWGALGVAGVVLAAGVALLLRRRSRSG